MTENAIHLPIQHVLPRNSARPKGSALFYEKLNPDVSLLVSGCNAIRPTTSDTILLGKLPSDATSTDVMPSEVMASDTTPLETMPLEPTPLVAIYWTSLAATPLDATPSDAMVSNARSSVLDHQNNTS